MQGQTHNKLPMTNLEDIQFQMANVLAFQI